MPVAMETAVERLLQGRFGPASMTPLNSLAWLGNDLGRMGRGLRAGDVVLTGSISRALRPRAGESVRASFTRQGGVACRFV